MLAMKRSAVAATALLMLALAGCQTRSANPALQTASAPALRDHLAMTCRVTQARLQGVSEAKVTSACSCYASRTLKDLNDSEIAALRQTAVFNASGREKALKAVDACKLKRP